MNPREDFDKLLKDLQDGARHFAQRSLQMSSKALDFTANRLNFWKTELQRQAERFGEEVPEGNGAPEATTPTEPQKPLESN